MTSVAYRTKHHSKPMRTDAVTLRFAAALALVITALLFWPVLERPTAASFRSVVGAALEPWTFGKGGHVVLIPAAHPHATVSAAASWDTQLELHIDGVEQRHRVALNPRRLCFLPGLLCSAVIVASPVSWRRKGLCIALSTITVMLLAIANVWMIAAWLFARVPGLIYDPSAWQRTMLDFGYEALVTSLATKFIAPVGVTIAIVMWQVAAERLEKITST